jgi:pimeloyl-ACP methyl ester carboxylesterase
MIFAIIGVAIVIFIVAFAFFLLRISIYKDTVGRSEENFRKIFGTEQPETLSWFDVLRSDGKVDDHYITNPKGERLHAYLIPCQEAKGTVILVHGYTGCSIQTLPHARLYLEKFHFNVAMLDLAHHASSDGYVTGMGWPDRLDVLQWASEVNRYFDASLPVVLHGLSMGGACVVMCAEEGLPACVKAVVDDSGFTSAFAEFSYEMKQKMHLPAFPLLHAASLLCKIKEGWSFMEASSIKTLENVEIPLLIIHGDADTRVPVSEGKRILATKKKNVEMWLVEGGTHINAITEQPEKYEQVVSDFLNKALR